MKKIFTLIAAALFTASVFAADRKPVVTLNTSRKYEVIVDGHSYFGNSIMNLSSVRRGSHSIKVYEISRSPFRKIKKLVSASSFQLRNNDVDITVNGRGQINIREDSFRDSHDNRDHGWDSRDGNKNDRNDRF